MCSPVVGVSKSNPGGIAVWLQNIINYHQKCPNGIKIDILSCDRSKYINENTGKVKRIYYGILDYLRIIKTIKKEIRATNYDAIHLCTTASLSLIKDYVVFKYAKKKNIQTVLHFHFGRIPKLRQQNNWEWKLLKKVVSIADKIIVIDLQSFRTLTEEGFTHIYDVPNPLSQSILDIIKCNQSIKRTPRRILFAGRVFRKKGIYELIEACSAIPNIQLRIVGYVDDMDKEALIKIANNGDWFLFVGGVPHDEVIKELMACDIFVMPTYTEGFPNAILESMATGTPTITTPVGAIPEMLNIDDDPCGICVQPKDVKSLRKAIIDLLDNNELKKELSKKSIIRVNELYSIDAVWKLLCEVWKHK